MNFHYKSPTTRKPTANCTVEEDNERETDLNIQVIKNNIYFYEEISVSSILYLCKCLSILEKKLLALQTDYQLTEIPKIYLHIHSSGGDAFAGLGAMNSIENCKVPVVCVADGIVASAATFLLMGAKERRMRKNSCILIHQIRTEFWGRYDELEDEMKNSKNLMRNIKRIYKQKSALPMEKIETIIKKEIYLTDNKCLKYGLVTELI